MEAVIQAGGEEQEGEAKGKGRRRKIRVIEMLREGAREPEREGWLRKLREMDEVTRAWGIGTAGAKEGGREEGGVVSLLIRRRIAAGEKMPRVEWGECERGGECAREEGSIYDNGRPKIEK